jgi:DNA-binding NarL/FixJ family response regulator
MKIVDHAQVIDTSLLAMDETQIVRIYAEKLTLLTKKQRVIFDLLCSGMRIKDIAKHLGYAEITVKVVKAKIMVLLDITTLQDLAVISKCCSCNYIKLNL